MVETRRWQAGTARWVVALAVGGAALGGCPGEEAPRRTPPIENFVTPKMDPAFKPLEVWETGTGFGAVQPGRTWTVTSADGRISLAETNERCAGWAEAVPGELGDPKAHGEAMLAAWCGAPRTCSVAEEGFALYNGKTAWRWEARRETGPGQVEMVRVSVLLNPTDGGGAWRLTVFASGTGRDYSARRRCLDSVTAAVSLGMPETPAPLPPAVDAGDVVDGDIEAGVDGAPDAVDTPETQEPASLDAEAGSLEKQAP